MGQNRGVSRKRQIGGPCGHECAAVEAAVLMEENLVTKQTDFQSVTTLHFSLFILKAGHGFDSSTSVSSKATNPQLEACYSPVQFHHYSITEPFSVTS